MSSDDKKKKKQSLRESIERLENSLHLVNGNKTATDAIKRTIKGLQDRLKAVGN